MSPHAMWTFHVVVKLPGWLTVRSPVSLRTGTFGACLRERGSTRTGNHHACEILSLVAHMAGPAVHYGGDERKLYPLIRKEIHLPHTRPDTNIITQKMSTHTFPPAKTYSLCPSLLYLSQTHIFQEVETIFHLLIWLVLHG